MEFWLGGEYSKEVLKTDEQVDNVFKARLHINEVFSKKLSNKSYDIPLVGWYCIMIIMGEDSFDERIFYSIKRKNMDFRLRIDPITFNSVDDIGREKLIFSMLLRSLDLLKLKFEKIRPKLAESVFAELDRLKSDAIKIAKEENWV